MLSPLQLAGLGYIAILGGIAIKNRTRKIHRLTPTNIVGVVNGFTLVQGGRLVSDFHAERGRRSWGAPIRHQGIDIVAPRGTPISAAIDGRIYAMVPDGELSGYGNTIITENIDGTGNLYAHLDSFADYLRVGDEILQGDTIGFVGSTQAPRGNMHPHLHFEVLSLPTTNIRLPRGPGEDYYPARLDPLDWLENLGVSIG